MHKFLAVILLSFPALLARADDVSELLTVLARYDQLQGNFEQRQQAPDDAQVTHSSGKFRLLRPGYFAWEVDSPDSQLIIANREFLWHHDRDLETVTRRPVADAVGMSPLQVLGGDETALRENFLVRQEGSDGAEAHFVLTPRGADRGFNRLTLNLKQGKISGMDILDNLGQQLSISFSHLDTTSPLTPLDFEFAPPPGADLFYYDE